MPYNNNYNNYRNPYLSNGVYRQSMNDVTDRDSYEGPEQDFIGNALQMAGLVTAVGGTSLYLYRGGQFRGFMHKFINDFGESNGLSYAQDAMEAVKKVTERKDTNILEDVVDIVHNNTIQDATTKGQSLRSAKKTMSDLKVIQLLKQKYSVEQQLKEQHGIEANTFNRIKELMNSDFNQQLNYDSVEAAKMMNRTGWRQATVGELIHSGHLNPTDMKILEINKNVHVNIMNKIADEHVLIDEYGKILDLRDSLKAVKNMGKNAINDFHIPILGINPAKMFHLDHFFDEEVIPDFHIIGKSEIQPTISRHAKELGKSFLYTGGRIVDIENGKILESNVSLVNARHGFYTRNMRKLSGVEVMKKSARWDTPVGRFAFNVFKAIDLHMQDEGDFYKHSFKLSEVSSWGPSITQNLREKFSPVANTVVRDIKRAYGKDTKYLVMKNMKTLKQDGAKDFVSQFFAGRRNMENVTKATMIPYMLIERVNGALQSVGLGLDLAHIGSAGEVFTNLMSRKILPVVIGIGALTYANHLLTTKDGKSPKTVMADSYVTASVNVAQAKDKLGVTGFLKKLSSLMPGWDQLEGLPIVGKLFSTKNAEETQEYWDHGDDAIRKGRYWTLGNTPYTGARISYFAPNWVREMKSNYKYTDVQYGSEDEYFDNWWLPTPTHPLAPIRHFFTDTKHWENKHYKDRPYPITGGIPEFKEIPIVGSAIDSTLGRILKPREKMHLEYWQGDKLKEVDRTETSMFSDVTTPGLRAVGAPGKYAIPQEADNTKPIIYETSSGQIEVMAADKKQSAQQLNRLLRTTSIKTMSDVEKIGKGEVAYGEEKNVDLIPTQPRGLGESAENTYQDITEMAGFYGFTFTSLSTEGQITKPRVQSSADMTSYTRSFWDKELGGLGGDVSEMFRRFVPKKKFATTTNELNPIRNTMPTWLPGPEYFTDFLHGDPYVKVANGEYRLPGAGYEAMHNKHDPTELRIGSSFVGHTKEEIIKHFLKVDDIELTQNANLKDILSNGTSVHEKIEKDWRKMGIAVTTEYHVEDKEHGIEGWIDAIIGDKSSKTGYSIVDFKTISNKGYEQLKTNGGKPENIAQINFYMYATGQNKAYLHYINRENPDAPTISFEYNYNPKLMKETFDKLEGARDFVRQGLNNGSINRGDLYDIMDRFRILADVAPYSDNYRYYSNIISKMDLKPEEKAEVQKIHEQVTDKKEMLRMYDYKFKTANLKYEKVKIIDVLDNGTIITDKYKENPIKMAGVDFSTNEKIPEGKAAMNYVHSHLRKGMEITIGYDADPLHQVKRDTYKSINAVIMQKGKNLNREMLQKKIAKENEKDNSPAGVHARYTPGQITYGKVWETLAHADTYFNTKFMQVRSPLEMYKRREVYGKDWQEWTHPVKDFLVPWAQNTLSHGFIQSVAIGAFVGSLFGSSKYGKIVGAAVGALTMGTLSAATELREMTSGETYIPERRKKERNLNEYMDILKYIKNLRLFEQYRKAAIDEENVDPAYIIKKNKEDGEKRKGEINRLTKIKRQLHDKKISFSEGLKQAKVGDAKDLNALEDAINGKINELTNYREVKDITPLAAQAIMYYNESEKTAYAYDSGEPIQNILSALNRKERRYFQPFLDAPEEERNEIIKLVPSYMKRALQSAYGMKVDAKPDLNKYFRTHALPGDSWAGWRADVDLDDVKIKMIKHEGMDMSEFDYWPDDEARAENLDIPVPKIDYHNTSQTIKNKLYHILHENGLNDVNVQVSVNDTPGIRMNVRIDNDRSQELQSYVDNYGL